MKKNRKIDLSEFLNKIKNKDGKFKNCIFDFDVDLSDMIFDFSFDFSGAVFNKSFKINETIFDKKIYLINSTFNGTFESVESVFNKEADFSRSVFNDIFYIQESFFKGDLFFDHVVFKEKADFSHCRFFSNIFFIKTHFSKSANFSYVFFNKDKQVSFVSINKIYEFDDVDLGAPFFIFRAVDFYENVEFRDIDLSRTVFQDSTFEDGMYFKECKFAQYKGRDCFYEEVARSEFFDIGEKYFDFFLKQKTIFFAMPYKISYGGIKELNISDKIIFKNNKIKKKLWKKYFIIEKDYFTDFNLKIKELEESDKKFNFKETLEILKNTEEKFYNVSDSYREKKKYIYFKLKRFNEVKSWENIEFLSRQMKRNLAGSTNWQKSGEFYIGEMKAKIKKLKLKKEDTMYRYFLYFYGLISDFGERTWKVVLTMSISFLITFFIIKSIRVSVDNFDILNYISTLFIPIFEDKSFSTLEFDWSNRGKMFFMFLTLWFYVLWFLLILSIQRKFKK